MELLRVTGLGKTYASRGGLGEQEAIRDLSFQVRKGETLAIFGPNGCGKTTLLNCLSGLASPTRGSIEHSNEAGNARKIGYVFQDYRASLLPWCNVLKNVALPLELEGRSSEDSAREAADLLLELGLDVPQDRYPYEVSGGQQQMIALARALIRKPTLLLLDEPFSALDYQTRLTLYDKLNTIRRVMETTVVLVSHDLDEALMLSDRTMLLTPRPAGRFALLEAPIDGPRGVGFSTTREFLLLKERAVDLFRRSLEAHL